MPSAHRAPHARAPCAQRARTWPAAAALACGGEGGVCRFAANPGMKFMCVNYLPVPSPALPRYTALHTFVYVCSVFLSGPIRPNIALAFTFKVEVF